MKKLLSAANNIPVDIKTVISILQEKWEYPDYVTLKGKHLNISTGGWSEHEHIISVLSKTLFWRMYWHQSNRGGHFKFKFDWSIKI